MRNTWFSPQSSPLSSELKYRIGVAPMPPTTEKDFLAWISLNWPSALIALGIGWAYVRSWTFVGRVEKLEKKMRRVQNVCKSQHPDQGAALFDDGWDDDGKR